MSSNTTMFKISNFRLDDDEKFNGENFVEFCESFKFLLKGNNISYLIETDSLGNKKDGPPGSNSITDNEILFMVLRLNLDKTASRIIGTYAAEQDGKKAWEAFVSHYETTDIGSLVGLLAVKRQLTWSGGDEKSFDEFVGEYLDVVTKLENRGWKTPDYILAGDLLERVPVEFTTQNLSLDLKDSSSLTFIRVKDAIKANIRLAQNKNSAAAYFTRGNNDNKNKKQDTHRRDGDKRDGDRRDGDRPRVTTPCGTCKMMGVADEKAMHSEKNCWNEKRFPDLVKQLREKARNGSSVNTEQTFANLAIGNNTVEHESCYVAVDSVRAHLAQDWIIDSGCTISMTPHISSLSDYTVVKNQFVTVGNNEKVSVQGYGQLAFIGQDGRPYRIMKVLHVPQIACNLLAVRVFTAKGASFIAQGNSATLKTRDGSIILQASLRNNLLHCSILPAEGVSSFQTSATCLLTQAAIIHRRFGHVSLGKMEGMPDGKDDRCEACVTGKFRRVAFNGVKPAITVPLEEVSVDLFGKSRVATAAGASYLLVITDTATSHTKVYFLKQKSEAFRCIVEYRQLMEKQTQFILKKIRSDGGGEFINHEMAGWCKDNGIVHAVNAPYSSVQNAYAERRIGIIINDTRTLLIDSGLPTSLWGYAAAHSVYIRNRLPSKDNTSPHELMFKRKPRIDHLKPFGCAAFAWIPDRYREEGKLNARADRNVLVGFEEGTSNARLYNIEDHRFFSSRDVRYFEDVYPAKGERVTDLSFLKTQWEISEPVGATDSVGVSKKTPVDEEEDIAMRGPILHDDNESSDDEQRSPTPEDSTPEPMSRQSSYAPSRQNSRSPIVTRSNARIAEMRRKAETLRQRRESTESREASVELPRGTVIHENLQDEDSDTSDDPMAMIVVLQTPATMTHALDGPDADAWQASLDKELASIDKAGTWVLVNEKDIPAGVRPIDSRLVLALKMDPTGGDDHVCKTRLVAKGFSQRPGIDFYDTFSPVGHRQSFRQLMTIVADLDLEVQGLDIATAFLHGDLEEEIYMKLPKEVTKGKRQVARLRKALYGLKQAGRCWNDKIDAWLRQQGWKASPEDPCLYVKLDGQDQVEMLLYIHVDDSVIAAKDNASIDAFVDYLDQFFPLRRQPNFSHMIGLEIHRDRTAKKLWITQQQYTLRILERFGLTECKTNKLPLSPSAAAVLQKGTEQDVNTARDLPYRELMGCLQYLATMTRPDICFAVNRLSSYCSAWTKKHFELAKGILRYVAGTRNHGLQLCTSNSGLEGFVDSDYNACLDDRTSTSGWLVKYRGGVIAWRSRKQKIVSHSTAESEYIAIDDIAKDLVWERRALSVLGDKQSNETSTKLNVDNKAAILMSRNRTNHDSTKHIDSRYHYIRDLVSSSIIHPVYIDTNENTADILTKALPRDKFEYHLEGLGVVEPPMLIQVGESVGVSKSG